MAKGLAELLKSVHTNDDGDLVLSHELLAEIIAAAHGVGKSDDDDTPMPAMDSAMRADWRAALLERFPNSSRLSGGAMPAPLVQDVRFPHGARLRG